MPQHLTIDEHTQQLTNALEALLFSEGGTLSRSKLSGVLKCTEGELSTVIRALSERLNGGIVLIETEKEVALTIAPSASAVVEEAYAPDKGDIGDAGLEVLSIILYRGPSTRATIDYIRGVNSSFSVRALLSRGLIERAHNPADSREYMYRPTTELLAHLGVKNSQELPEYATVVAELATFEAKQTHDEFRAEQSGSTS